MKLEYVITLQVNMDEAKFRMIHGDKWIEGFNDSAIEFVKELETFLAHHPFVEACDVIENGSRDARALTTH